MSNAYEEYMRQVTQPMRRELTEAGFTELTTADEVNEFMATAKGVSLVVINSVCGCAAGLARPAAREAMEMVKPDNLLQYLQDKTQKRLRRCADFLKMYHRAHHRWQF